MPFLYCLFLVMAELLNTVFKVDVLCKFQTVYLSKLMKEPNSLFQMLFIDHVGHCKEIHISIILKQFILD